MHVILEENETYKSILDNILKLNNIKKYKKYVRDIYLDRFLLNLDCKEDDFEIIISKKICFYVRCMNEVIVDNYCSIHNKDII